MADGRTSRQKPSLASQRTGENSGNSAVSADDLSDRERTIYRMLREGQSYEEIADELQLSGRTVEKHADNIREKLEGTAIETLQGDPWLERVAQWDELEADQKIREGLPIEIATHLQSLLDLTDDEAAHLIGRSRSTYSRYRNAGRTLGPADSERAVRFAQLVVLAADTFGSLQDAAAWMQEENYALGGERPLKMAETDPGARVVRDLLLGLQHGHPV